MGKFREKDSPSNNINNICFSALNMGSVREKAKEVGLEESLKLLIGISPEETSHQLEFCLQQLCSPASSEDPVEGDSEDEEEEEDEVRWRGVRGTR
eukprot:sb/3479208/